MTSAEYITIMVKTNNFIYIDTASLMNTEELLVFIKRCKVDFFIEGKRIIVPQAVTSELYRFLSSHDETKRKIAIETLDVLDTHQELFEIEGGKMDEDETSRAFADAELLATLTINKALGNQLLITNDRDLSKDAYDLNNQQSYKGHSIRVCYINRFGELQMCDCVKGCIHKRPITRMNSTNPPLVEKPKIKTIQSTLELSPSNGSSGSGKKNIITFICAFAGGILVNKYGKTILKGVLG